MLKTKKSKWTIGIFCALTSIFAVNFVTAQESGNGGNKVSLRIATVLNAPSTTLAFTIENKSDKAIETTPLATNSNRIIIVKPNGETIEQASQKRFAAPTVIQSASAKTWKLDIAKILGYWKLNTPGEYKVYWKLNSYESPKISLLKDK